MTLPHCDSDDGVLAELRAALAEAGQVPREFVTAALGAFAWRTVDAELVLAELVFDSSADAELALRTRSRASVRTLTFQGNGVHVDVELADGGIAGQVVPVTGGEVAAETAAGVFDRAEVDGTGCFLLGAPPPGPVRLRLRTGRYRLVTGWVCAD
jgi:hypothetical protein